MESEYEIPQAHPTIRLKTALACWMFSPIIGIASYIHAKSRLEQTQLMKPSGFATRNISQQDTVFVRVAFVMILLHEWLRPRSASILEV